MSDIAHEHSFGSDLLVIRISPQTPSGEHDRGSVTVSKHTDPTLTIVTFKLRGFNYLTQ